MIQSSKAKFKIILKNKKNPNNKIRKIMFNSQIWKNKIQMIFINQIIYRVIIENRKVNLEVMNIQVVIIIIIVLE